MIDALLPHQETAANFLASRGPALLWDDMGLGKTYSAVAGADRAGCRKILVCCPAAVRPHWAREFLNRQTVQREVTVVEGNPKTPPGGDVTIISHAAFSNANALEMLRAGAPYDVFIIDEAHQFRAYGAQRVLNLLAIEGGAWRWSWRAWFLTGTPVVNSAGDLWPLLSGPFHHTEVWWDFVNRFADMKQGFDGLVPTGLKNPEELAQILRRHVLRRTIESIGINLPPLTVEQTDLDIDQGALATAMAGLADWTPQRLQKALDENDEIKDEALARVRHALGLAKVLPAATYAWHLMNAKKGPVVVFFQHTEVRKRLYEILAHWGFKVSWIDGKITPAQLTAAESWFQEGKLDILLAQTQSAGQGLTLTRASTCISMELPWTSVAVQQSHKRIHRIGQNKPCTAHVLRAKGCWLEDVLSSVVSKKQKASETLLNLLTTNA